MKAYVASMFGPIVCVQKRLFSVEAGTVPGCWHLNQYFTVLFPVSVFLSLSLCFPLGVGYFLSLLFPSLSLSPYAFRSTNSSLSCFSSSAFLLASFLLVCFSSFVPRFFSLSLSLSLSLSRSRCCCRHFVIAQAKTVTLLLTSREGRLA